MTVAKAQPAVAEALRSIGDIVTSGIGALVLKTKLLEQRARL